MAAIWICLLAGCLPSGSKPGTTILVSLDGFRWDFRGLVEVPALDRLAADGVVGNLRPCFPSLTFPCHHTIATGLHAGRHGVVGNTTYDPTLDVRFRMGGEGDAADGRWWGGEPIWVTAEKAGLTTATFFWPGSEAEIEGVRPTYWKPYDGRIPGEDRVAQVLEWLDLPEAERPRLITLYLSDVDRAGHRYGPNSEQMVDAVKKVDTYLQALMQGLSDRGLDGVVNVLVVADHGIVQQSADRVVFLDDYVDLERANALSLGAHMALWPDEEDVDGVFDALDDAHPALLVYKRGTIPERLHFDGSPRIPPIVGIVEEGWTVSTRAWAEERENPYSGGTHGYDNNVPDMAGVFIAAGPAIRSGVQLETIDAVDVYNMLAGTLGIDPSENDGDPAVARRVLN